jgi:sec-independent protein translocase protein TatB
MFGGSFGEMLIIAVVALVFLGPEKFPEFAKIAMRAIRDIRGYMDEVRSEVTKEINPIKNELQQLTRMDPETYINKLVSEPDPVSSKASDAAAKVYGDEPSSPQPSVGSGSEYPYEPEVVRPVETPAESSPEEAKTPEPAAAPEAKPAASAGESLTVPERLDG